MILIADSGSTKTTWKVVEEGNVVATLSTIGMNPYFLTQGEVERVLKEDLSKSIDVLAVDSVYFYGAGCSSEGPVSRMKRAFRSVFRNAEVEIEHDLLGAARALCGHEPGVACILGTGSNSCYYDGKEVTKNVRALGFILGDEGAASYMGKQLIKDYLDDELPVAVRERFEDAYDVTPEEILDRVYSQSRPNTFLASFAQFLGENKADPYCRHVIRKSLRDFMAKSVLKYDEATSHPIHFVGSVAYFNRDALEDVLKAHKLILGKVIRAPIDDLVEFHLKQLA